jgi:hypothetical protein
MSFPFPDWSYGFTQPAETPNHESIAAVSRLFPESQNQPLHYHLRVLNELQIPYN